MRKLISVTRKDINEGKKLSQSSCPIALAIRRDLDIAYVRVEENFVRILDDYFTHRHLSSSAQKFIDNFDNKGKKSVKPFSFYLEV